MDAVGILMSSAVSGVGKTGCGELWAFKCWLSKRQIMEFSQFALVSVFSGLEHLALISSDTNARSLFSHGGLIGGLRQRAEKKGRTVRERSVRRGLEVTTRARSIETVNFQMAPPLNVRRQL